MHMQLCGHAYILSYQTFDTTYYSCRWFTASGVHFEALASLYQVWGKRSLYLQPPEMANLSLLPTLLINMQLFGFGWGHGVCGRVGHLVGVSC